MQAMRFIKNTDTGTKYLIKITLTLLLLVLQVFLLNLSYAKEFRPDYNNLILRLQRDGFDEIFLQKLFNRPELSFMTDSVAKGLTRKEANLNYGQFLEKDMVDRASLYLKAYDKTLQKTEDRFGVSGPIVVAILSIETRLGSYLGHLKTLNILITQTLCLEPDIYEQIYQRIPARARTNLTHQEIKKRLKKKSIRAYRELKAFLEYTQNSKTDPFVIKGSPEGAIGLPQFLPSNIKRYGFDGNGDDEIDLFQHEDAIASVASYLKAHKWREDTTTQRKKKIILKYNNSIYYASTVLKLAERLEHHWH